MPTLGEYIPNRQQFQIFWPCPVRAHVGIDIDFRFSWYEVDNERLEWILSGAPSWMKINKDTGVVFGKPPEEKEHKDILVTAKRGSGLTISRSFTCTVDNSKFIFVSTDGSDGDDGTLTSPYRTLAYAISKLSPLVGKSIYVRGGNYVEGYATQASPFSGKDRDAADYQELRSYPGERAYWDFGANGYGGFDFNIRYGVISNMTIGNGSRVGYPKLLTLSSEWGVLKDCIIKEADGVAGNNLCGCEIKPTHDTESNANILVDRCVFHDCYQKNKLITDSSQDNSTGMDLFGNSGPSGGNPNFYIWVLNSKGYSNGYAFKVKHSGLDRIIVHNCESHSNGRGNFHLGGPFVSMRHCVSFNTLGAKCLVPCADNNAAGPAWYERNTFVESGAPTTVYMLNFQSSVQSNGGTFKHNIVAATTGSSRSLFRLWEDEVDWSTYDINVDRNLYFNAPDSKGFIAGGGSPSGIINYADWQAKTLANGKTLDTNSLKADPGFVDARNGDLNLSSSSPAANIHEDGAYVGALEPGKNYGKFGRKDETLVDFNINGATVTAPEPEPVKSQGYFGYRRRMGARA